MDEGKSTSIGDLLELYNVLVGQVQNYNGIIWQIPIALIVANFVALDYCTARNPWALFALFVFSCALIYAFYKMVVRQRVIIVATKVAEAKLSSSYGECIPKFKKHGVSAPMLLVGILAALNVALLAYAVLLVRASAG